MFGFSATVVVEGIYLRLEEIKSKGTSLFVVEQNIYTCLNMVNRGYVLESGKFTMEGDGRVLQMIRK